MKTPTHRFISRYGLPLIALVAGCILRLILSSSATTHGTASSVSQITPDREIDTHSPHTSATSSTRQTSTPSHPTAQDGAPRVELPASFKKNLRIDLFNIEMNLNRESLYQLGFTENEVTDIETLGKDIIASQQKADLQRMQILEQTPERTLIHLKSDPESAARTREKINARLHDICGDSASLIGITLSSDLNFHTGHLAATERYIEMTPQQGGMLSFTTLDIGEKGKQLHGGKSTTLDELEKAADTIFKYMGPEAPASLKHIIDAAQKQ